MALWKLEESRLVQVRSNSSAADALFFLLGYPGPTQGKLWVVTGCGYKPSVAETQVVSFEKYNNNLGIYQALLNPVEMNLNPAHATFIEQGMEYLLFPSEYVVVRRVAATAGSSMAGWMEVIEIDQPLYTYEEPQLVKRQSRAISSLRQRLGGSPGSRGSGGPGSSPGTIPHGGGGGGALPV